MSYKNTRSDAGDNFFLIYFFKKKAKMWKIAFFVALITILFLLLKTTPNRAIPSFKPYIARVYIDGMITTNNGLYDRFSKLIADNHVKGVIVEINSGGGTITGSEILYTNLRKLSAAKPTVSLIKDVGASGAYLSALGTDHIIAYQSSIVGSIGVIMQNFNLTGALKKIGVGVDIYRSSKYKASPLPFEEQNPVINEYMMEGINEAFDFFKNIVKERRNLSSAELDLVANGKVFSGRKALKLKLIDEVGTHDSAENYLKKERKLAQDLQIIDYTFSEDSSFLDKIIEKISKRKEENTRIMAIWPGVV